MIDSSFVNYSKFCVSWWKYRFILTEAFSSLDGLIQYKTGNLDLPRTRIQISFSKNLFSKSLWIFNFLLKEIFFS